MKKRILISLLVAVMVIGGLLAGVAFLWSSYGDSIMKRFGLTDLDYPGPGSGEAIITIYEGEIGGDIARTLAEEDVVMTADAFYDLLLKRPEVSFSPGTYQLKLQMSAEGALEALLDPENRLQRFVALREGLTVEQTLERLAAGTAIPVEAFESAIEDVSTFGLPDGVASLEGWLYPANYEFEPDADATAIVQRLVDEQLGLLARLGVPAENQLEVLTTASIIEKEAGIASDFGKVSRVIANRLEIGQRLEMDSTAQYGYGEHADGEVWSSQEALQDDNGWNTYVHQGLPIGPIANPGAAAVEAALNPEPGDWLYFVVSPGGTGASTFTTTYDEHLAAVDEYREWCQSTPGSGC